MICRTPITVILQLSLSVGSRRVNHSEADPSTHLPRRVAPGLRRPTLATTNLLRRALAFLRTTLRRLVDHLLAAAVIDLLAAPASGAEVARELLGRANRASGHLRVWGGAFRAVLI